MLKKLLSCGLIIAVSTFAFTPHLLAASSEEKLVVNGKEITPKHPLLIKKGDPFMSLETLSSIETFDTTSKIGDVVTIEMDDVELEYDLDDNTFTVNDEKVNTSSKPFEEQGTVYIPVKDWESYIGFDVVYDDMSDNTYVFLKEKNPVQPATSKLLNIEVSGDEVYWDTSYYVEPEITRWKDPQRMHIDLPNTELSSDLKNNATMSVNNDWVQSVRFEQLDSTARIILDLYEKIDYEIDANAVQRDVMMTMSEYHFKIVLDAGHGDHDPGARGHSGGHEKDFVLSVTTKVEDLLRQEEDVTVYMTRQDDTFVELYDRGNLANEVNADLFISIHGNAHDKESINGTETYYWQDESLEFASIVHEELIETTGFVDRGVKKTNFKVIRVAQMPGVLLEIGFLTNPGDEAAMLNEQFQVRVAEAIVDAIKTYFEMEV
ncbi:N-acetylmuramoyl-L-alanine amidase [Longirhabdus pacifica]|uniref:N-acetylmuramoyl-L-alanine amidase n=1 Tax=Longirhabdus pacifica TaxID=2305227 RepID=UPI001008781D|nr:N-acetylmuramoyl-L-alanine amidase [Longirhabdus pacifica]